MTNEQTHTPGPWYVSHYQATVANEDTDERVATVFGSEANARLIAAAPDLLHALRIVEAQTDREWMGEDGVNNVRIILQTIARDAIAKATGGE